MYLGVFTFCVTSNLTFVENLITNFVNENSDVNKSSILCCVFRRSFRKMSAVITPKILL